MVSSTLWFWNRGSAVSESIMSSQKDVPCSQDSSTSGERVVTDSVHGRFRPLQVHCDICNMDLIGNSTAIENHFKTSHPSKEYCSYCKGKVFRYTRIPANSFNNERSEEFVYHKCHNS